MADNVAASLSLRLFQLLVWRSFPRIATLLRLRLIRSGLTWSARTYQMEQTTIILSSKIA